MQDNNPPNTQFNVLISVSNKEGLGQLGKELHDIYGDRLSIYSTGGTYIHLKKILPAFAPPPISIDTLTGRPELDRGIIKTLHYAIFLGLLANLDNPQHIQEVHSTKTVLFDLLVVNLYPFHQIASQSSNLEDRIAGIDVGGAAMLRAAAKNSRRVATLCRPSIYPIYISRLREGTVDADYRLALAKMTFRYLAQYDNVIAQQL